MKQKDLGLKFQFRNSKNLVLDNNHNQPVIKQSKM